MADDDPKPTVLFNRDKPQWPMSFTLRPPVSDKAPPRRWWNHDHYRGPKGEPIQLLYSKTKAYSEVVAKQFLNEPVLGFDMEWPMDADKRPRRKDKVALIQLACERKVGLFHISLHEGDEVDDLIAPSLKEILESPKIIKTGVAILRVDFHRLKTHFQLEPKGAFELSHLYNLITFGPTTPRMVTTRLRNLSLQVEQHLGLPLWKGGVRTSDWSRPLNWSQTQYAATDVYAGFMLFHCMNAKRLAMDPAPPFPRFAETYLAPPVPGSKPTSTLIQLESVTEDGEIQIVSALDFFMPKQNIEGGEGTEAAGITEHKEAQENTNVKSKKKEDRRPRREQKLPALDPKAPMSSSCRALYDRLSSHRLQTSHAKGVTAFVIAWNSTLEAIAFYRPSNEQELLLVPGVGKGKAAEFGAAWLEIIAEFVAEHGKDDVQEGLEPDAELDGRDPKRRRTDHDAGPSEGISIPSHAPPAAVPSTSSMPHLGNTNPADIPPALPRLLKPKKLEDYDDDDDDAIFGPPLDLPSPSVLKRKRDAAQHKPSLQTRVSAVPAVPVIPAVQTQAVVLPTVPTVQTRVAVVAAVPVVPIVSRVPVAPMAPVAPAVLTAPPAPKPPSPPAKPGPTPTPAPTCILPPNPHPPAPRPAPPSTPMRTRSSTAARLPHPHLSPESLARERALLRRKLEAYIKSVVRALRTPPTEALASESMLQYLVTTVPRTVEEFRRAPGVWRLLRACEMVRMDVWRAFQKWTRTPRVLPGGAGAER
ncbi:hypothetical protein GGS24DRAFT_374417 [Hypoxylon argillaceum]|nr:hypothetical protein GGS24DRAFT_374417 [Hypoxylon argillaceum]